VITQLFELTWPGHLLVKQIWSIKFLRATAGTAIVRLSYHSSVCPSICLSVHHMDGSVKNGAS